MTGPAGLPSAGVVTPGGVPAAHSTLGPMLDGIEALAALEQLGTISEAAARLRLTQSAVSKRLQALQDTVGFRLIEPDGRRVRLTARGLDFVQRARPLMAELRALTRPVEGPSVTSLSLALADSIASSWGPEVVSRALAALPGLRVDLHAHRSVLVVENVRLGRYHVGLCTAPPAAKDLVQHELVAEPLVLVHAGLGARADRRRPLITIEPSSATWRAVEPLLRQHHPELLGGRLVPVESFGAALQMVKAGFGDGVVPLGLVMETRLPRRAYRALEGVERRIALVTRKTVDQLQSFHALRDRLLTAARAHLTVAR
jgi:DNA-binding transcriptional LysR family regulator